MSSIPIAPASPLHALLRPLLFLGDAEAAHDMAMDTMEIAGRFPRVLAHVARCHAVASPGLRTRALGLDFGNPLGVAAGLDKDARALPALAALGFGHVEIGTITPKPQPGNPRQRIWRLPEDGALVNSMGFPSQGAARVAQRLAASGPRACLVAVNLGRNKDTPNERAEDDYLEALELLQPHGDWFVVNVSSPNTPGLRKLQDPASLRRLVEAVVSASAGKAVAVKLSPDLDDAAFDAALDAAGAGGARGVTCANTTSSRPARLMSRNAALPGGLSGAPLLRRMLDLVARTRIRGGDRLDVTAVGGIATAQDARRALEAGASLVQVYTAFVYAGPGLARAMLRGLVAGSAGRA